MCLVNRVLCMLQCCEIISKIFGLSMEIVTNQLMARALDYNRSLPFPVVWLKCCGFTNLFLSNFRVGQCKYLKPSKNIHEMPEIRASHDWEQVKLQHCSQTTGKGKLLLWPSALAISWFVTISFESPNIFEYDIITPKSL